MAGATTASNVSLSKLKSLHGIFAIYKKQGPTSADVLNALKMALLKGNVFISFQAKTERSGVLHSANVKSISTMYVE